MKHAVIVMNSFEGFRVALLLAVWAVTSPGPMAAQTTQVLPSPLSLSDVIRLASERPGRDPGGARTRSRW